MAVADYLNPFFEELRTNKARLRTGYRLKFFSAAIKQFRLRSFIISRCFCTSKIVNINQD